MLNLNETKNGIELYKKHGVLVEVTPYLHYKHFIVHGPDIRCCLWTAVYCTCKNKSTHTHTNTHNCSSTIFPLLILTPSKFMLGLLANNPMTYLSSSSCFGANSKLQFSISDVYPGKVKRKKKFLSKPVGARNNLIAPFFFTGINNHFRTSS